MKNFIKIYKELAPDILIYFIFMFVIEAIFYDLILSIPELRPEWTYKNVLVKICVAVVWSFFSREVYKYFSKKE